MTIEELLIAFRCRLEVESGGLPVVSIETTVGHVLFDLAQEAGLDTDQTRAVLGEEAYQALIAEAEMQVVPTIPMPAAGLGLPIPAVEMAKATGF